MGGGGDGLEWKKGLRFQKYPDTCGGGLKVHINNPTSSPESICIPIWRAIRPCDEVSLNSGTSMAFFKEESVSRIIQWSTAENVKVFANSGCCYSSFRTDYGVFRNGLFSNKRQAPYNLSKAPNCYSL